VPKDVEQLLVGYNEDLLVSKQSSAISKSVWRASNSSSTLVVSLRNTSTRLFFNLVTECPERSDDDGQLYAVGQKRATKDQFGRFCFTGASGHLNDGGLAFENISLTQDMLSRP